MKPKHQEFADLYRGGPPELRGNAKACYQALHPRANATTAVNEGSRYLKHPDVQDYLASKARALEADCDITQARILKELAALAFLDPRQLYDPDTGELLPVDRLPEEIARAVASLEVDDRMVGQGDNARLERTKKVKLWSKLGALELLMKHKGMLREQGDGGADGPVRAVFRVVLEPPKALPAPDKRR